MTIPFKGKGCNERIVEILFVHRFIDFSKNHLILEIGCGKSWLLFELATFGHKVVGVDIDNKYPYKHPNITSYKMDAEDFKHKDKFDYIISVSTLEHIRDNEKLQNIIDNIYCHLKPKGIFILTVPIGKKELWKTSSYYISICEPNEWVNYCKEFELIYEEIYIRRSESIWEKSTRDCIKEIPSLKKVKHTTGVNGVGCFCFKK